MVMPYFGRWPEWFDFFLQSCESNATVDWLFYTDCAIPERCPQNTEFVNASLADFNKMASQKLGLPIDVKDPYKLCDFRPAYGVIFEDHLKGYDFWGWGDVDMIYGNIRKFFTGGILSNYDVITTNRTFLSGPFTILKNNRLKYLYQEIPEHKKVFLSEIYLGFDESGPGERYQVFLIDPVPCRNNGIKSMSHLVAEMAIQGKLSLYAKNLGTSFFHLPTRIKLEFDNGNLVNAINNKETLFFHILNLKRFNDFLVPTKKEDAVFFITHHQIHYGHEISLLEKIKRNFRRLSKCKGNFFITEVWPLIDARIGEAGIWLDDKHPVIYRRLKGAKEKIAAIAKNSGTN